MAECERQGVFRRLLYAKVLMFSVPGTVPGTEVGKARPERFELPTLGFEVRCSIQLSYGRIISPRSGLKHF